MADAHIAGLEGSGLDPLLERIRLGSEDERATILEELAAKAQILPLHPNALNTYGISLLAADRRYAAVAILNRLSKTMPATPEFKLNLALACWYAEFRRLTRHHLQSVVNDDLADENMIAEAKGRLQQYFGSETYDCELHQLQRAALAERRREGNMEASHFIVLARLIEAEVATPADEAMFDEARSVLEEGQRLHPRSVPLLERLAFAYIRVGRLEDYDRVLLAIERNAPRSAALEALESGLDRPPDRNEQATLNQALASDVVQADDLDLREAALAELALRAAKLPNDEDRRTAYAFALVYAGEREQAVEEGEGLLAEMDDSHELHFNLGQLFWKAGDERRGRHHLDLASEWARSKEERRDVEAVIERMSSSG